MVGKKQGRKGVLKLYRRNRNLSLRLYAFTPADILWRKKRIIGLSLKKGVWKRRSFPLPHAVYNRCYNQNRITVQRLEKAIGKNKCFNNINSFNKWELYNLFKQSSLGCYVPDTFLYREAKISELLEKYKQVYIKPPYGHQGKSVYRVELADNGDTHISLHSVAPRYICRRNEDIQGRLDKLLGRQNYMVQQGIQVSQLNRRYFDIRALVQKGMRGEWTVSALIARVAYEGYFNTSMCDNVRDAADILLQVLSPEKTNEILLSLFEVSVKAAAAAEAHIGLLGELSVDFALDEQSKLWIIELNGKPQKNIYDDLREIKRIVYSRPLEYAYYLSQS